MAKREHLDKLRKLDGYWEARIASAEAAYDWAAQQQTDGPCDNETWCHWMEIRVALHGKIEDFHQQRASLALRIALVEREIRNAKRGIYA
ncbi:MAG: hypothetical protein M0T77_01070 [Actinomycetota bacterium]|nr:hypothetical protein [Actinomycetota bacterium]